MNENLSQKRVRVGVLGLGKWGRNILRTLLDMPELVDVRWAAARERIPVDKIDALFIATPAPTLREITAGVLTETGSAERPTPAIFVEKPLAFTSVDMQELQALWESGRKAPFMVDYTYLFDPGYEWIRRAAMFQNNRLFRARIVMGDSRTVHPDTGPLWDWGPHAAALAVDLQRLNPKAEVIWSVAATLPERTFKVDVEVRRGSAPDAAHHAYRLDGTHLFSGRTIDYALPIQLKHQELQPRPLTAAITLFVHACLGIDSARRDPRLGFDLPLAVTKMIEARARGEA